MVFTFQPAVPFLGESAVGFGGSVFSAVLGVVPGMGPGGVGFSGGLGFIGGVRA